MKKNSILWLFSQCKPALPRLILLTFVQMGNAFFGVMFALGSRGVIDAAVEGNAQAFFRAAALQCGIILGILVCLTLTRHLRERLRADMDRQWKQRLLHGLLHGEYEKVSAYHSAELLNRLNNDVTKVDEGVITILPSVSGMAVRLLAALAILGILDWKFTVLVASLGSVVMVSTAVMRRKLKNLNKQVSEHDGIVSGFLQELMEKLLMVQAMDLSQEVERRSDHALEARYQVQRRKKNISLFANTSISIMYYGAGFFALLWSGWRLLHGQITFGSLTAVIQLVNQLQTPFVDLSGVLPKYMDMVASSERLMELEEIQGQPVPMVEEPEKLYENMTAIAAENLTFSYDRDRILDKAYFRVPKGVFAVITGPSGIGKSTLLKLLLGVFRPESGKLTMDCGEKRVPLNRSTRRMFAYVPQGNLLLSGTIRENLTITAPDASEEEIQRAVYISCMDGFLAELPLGLDTPLGESGAGLSEGQVQRLAIARAVLGGAPILLLDECTSALDAETEQLVLTRLRILPNRTCLAVTHRPAAIALCDYRLEVNHGQIQLVKNETDAT